MDLPEKNRTSDDDVIAFAIKHNRIIITKDNDFLDSFLLKSKPEKLIMVKTGNISNTALIDIFGNNLNIIVNMISRSKLVEINKLNIAEQT
jgi:predicted nuclease of predicted toxin-antitoxin system